MKIYLIYLCILDCAVQGYILFPNFLNYPNIWKFESEMFVNRECVHTGAQLKKKQT